MNDFLMILIEAMKTVDGNRGSFDHVEELVLDHKIKQKLSQNPQDQTIKQVANSTKLSRQEINSINQTTLMKFKLMRIRSKMSFQAFIKKQTILENIMQSILDTYDLLIKLGEKKETQKMKQMNDRGIFDSIMKDSLLSALRTVIKNNIEQKENQELMNKLTSEETLAYLFKSKQKLVYSKDKLGQKQIKMINHGQIMNNVKRIKALLNKDTAFDIFQDLNIAGDKDKTIDYQKLINYKNNRLYKQN